MVDGIYSELDFVFICTDGKKFLDRKEAEDHEEVLKGENYKIFNRQENRMKYAWFFIGYLTALVTLFVASCTYTPLEASNSGCGEESWNPC